MPRSLLFRRPAAVVVTALVLSGAIATASVAAETPTTTTHGRAVPTTVSERATVRVGGLAGVAPTSTTQGFLGIATSLSTIPGLAGSPTDPDTPFINLVKSLSPGAPPLLRLGGNSGDLAWWPIPGMEKRLSFLYKLTPRWGARVHALLTALGGKAILGVNLKVGPKNVARIAPLEVADFNRYVGAGLIDAFELGNEPEFYPLSIVEGRGAPGHTTIAAYAKEYTHIASMFGGAPLAGPGSVGPVWQSELGTVLSDLPARLKLATVHAYALKHCSHFARLSMGDFFARASIQGLAASIHSTVKAAAAHGKPLRVDEFNGITCGGKAGLSNSFGEALWALNVLPALWRAGVQGVNIQSIYGDLNQVIHANHSHSGWSITVQPEYYGLLAFADAAPAGSHLLRTSNPGMAHLFQFAVRAPDGSERIILTNVGSAPRRIGVSASGRRGTGSLSLLRASSLNATGGTTLAGQRLSPRTGQLTGTPRMTAVRPNARGVYGVRVPAHTAAILTLGAGSGGGGR